MVIKKATYEITFTMLSFVMVLTRSSETLILQSLHNGPIPHSLHTTLLHPRQVFSQFEMQVSSSPHIWQDLTRSLRAEFMLPMNRNLNAFIDEIYSLQKFNSIGSNVKSTKFEHKI